jgi:membrane-associated protease RseP (regulator of RpoE activity)
MGQSVLGQALLGNSYSTPPRRFFRFNVAEINGLSRVQASGWMEVQMAFGQTRRTDFSGPEFQNSIFNFMGAAGGQFPVGTTFPNHVVLGFRFSNVPMGAYHGMRITELAEGSAAAKAGLQVGDVVTAINGKRFKKQDDYLDATAQAAQQPTYAVEYMRDGTKMTATLERQFRPAITQTLAASPTVAAPTPVATPTASIADELDKLVKLRDSGVLTVAEFEAQKQKLLAQ